MVTCANKLSIFGRITYIFQLWQIEQLKAPLKKNLWSKCASVKVDTRWPLYTVSWNKNSGMIAVGGGDRRVR